jgi:hypothetical protein
MISNLRDEPPMLGSSGAGAKGPAIAGGPNGRTSPSNDLYAQSFARTQPKPVAPASLKDDGTGTEAAPADPARTPTSENDVRTTGLSPGPDSSHPTGVILKPPVTLPTSFRSTVHPTPRPSGPSKAPESVPQRALTNVPPREAEQHESADPAVESIVAAAQAKLDSMTAYQVEINRQERVGDTLQEPEDVVLSIRRNPKAVRLEWRQGAHKGREVLFSEKETNGLMRINMADSPIPIPPLALPPDSPLVLRNSRHPITEAGFDAIFATLKKSIEENKAGDTSHGRVKYAGREQPEQLDHPCDKIVRVTPKGETWTVFLDPDLKMPAMIEETTSSGDLLERYFFRNVHCDPPELASSEAFDPSRRWGEGRGLLNRLAESHAQKSKNPNATAPQ